jgi:hypothetical protein
MSGRIIKVWFPVDRVKIPGFVFGIPRFFQAFRNDSHNVFFFWALILHIISLPLKEKKINISSKVPALLKFPYWEKNLSYCKKKFPY